MHTLNIEIVKNVIVLFLWTLKTIAIVTTSLEIRKKYENSLVTNIVIAKCNSVIFTYNCIYIYNLLMHNLSLFRIIRRRNAILVSFLKSLICHWKGNFIFYPKILRNRESIEIICFKFRIMYCLNL